ncbi:MAG TPA: transcription antitermination factor NusB, partial [Micromonosporaceae bacterium]|nr:transcription antitermination factor NusB [Micromonosporaceae bacterium]
MSPGPTRKPARRADPAREAAFQVLRAVDERAAYANLALPGLLRQRGITGRDAALATELCYGTLRTLGTLDAILAQASSRPLGRIQAPVRDALRLGGYQLLYTRMPPHAAVDSTVALVRGQHGHRATGFVNAVLRRVAEHDLDDWLEQITPSDPTAALAVRHAHPEWAVRAFADALDGDLDEAAAALAADNRRPIVHLAGLPGRIDPATLADQASGQPGFYSPYAVYLPEGGAPAEIAAVAQRLATVQDEGSQLVALATAGAVVSGEDHRWLDLCAGPGGKAVLLGALARQRNAEVTAVEVAGHRARLVREATRDLPVRVVHADGRQVGDHPGLPTDGFDRVLVDAPCTGLGALRRRPEARWRRTPGDLAALTVLQRQLLAAGLRAVRPGGVLGYVTCSPHLDETAAVIDQFSREFDDILVRLDARS